jgi:hypothetical protein
VKPIGEEIMQLIGIGNCYLCIVQNKKDVKLYVKLPAKGVREARDMCMGDKESVKMLYESAKRLGYGRASYVLREVLRQMDAL